MKLVRSAPGILQLARGAWRVARGSQVTRQWRVLRLLEGCRAGLRAVDIRQALENEVTERTVFRDLRHLQAAGYALFEERGRWRVLINKEGGHATPVEPTELSALLLSKELLEPMRSSEVASALERLRKKVSALLTPIGRRYVEELAGSLIATFTAPGDYGERGTEIQTIEEAIHKQHTLRLSYWSPRGEGGRYTEREVDPYALWFADGRLFLVGRCHSVRRNPVLSGVHHPMTAGLLTPRRFPLTSSTAFPRSEP